MRHYGQHAVCALCDAEGRFNAPEAIAARQRASERAAEARAVAREMQLPEHVVNRAVSFYADATRGHQTAREAIAAAVERDRVADPSYTPTVAEALRHPDAFVEGMEEM